MKSRLAQMPEDVLCFVIGQDQTFCMQDSGQKLTYAQIIQKKKEAAEALERERAAAAAAGQPLETKGKKE